jgi:hypothetical protein
MKLYGVNFIDAIAWSSCLAGCLHVMLARWLNSSQSSSLSLWLSLFLSLSLRLRLRYFLSIILC